MQDIKQLQLSDHDFKMLVDGLDALPNKDEAGNILMDVMTATLVQDPLQREKMKRENEEKKNKAKAKKEMLVEDIRILQGKLIQFRRYLEQEGLLVEAQAILDQR